METFQALAKSQCKIDFWATLKIQWGTQFDFLDNFDVKYIKYTLQEFMIIPILQIRFLLSTTTSVNCTEYINTDLYLLT